MQSECKVENLSFNLSIKLASALILISVSGLGLAASFTVLPRMRHETGEISAQCSGLSAVAGCCPLGKLSAEKLYNLLSPLGAPDWPGSALQLPAHHQPVTSDQPHLRTQWGHALSLRVSRISHTRRKSALYY